MTILDFWHYFFGFGFVAGLVFRVRGLLWLTLGIVGFAFSGLLLSGLIGEEAWTWIFGLALMASPILGGVAVLGALAGWLMKLVVKTVTARAPDDTRG